MTREIVENLCKARLISLPIAATAADYELAADEIESTLLDIPGVISVFRLGSVSAPGISDIDRVAVVDRKARLPDVWPKLSQSTRALAMHSPFAVDRETFERHKYFAYLEPLELAWGEQVSLAPPPPASSARLLAVESFTLNLLRIAKKAATRHIKVRSTLCELHTIRHGHTLAGLSPSSLSYEVTELRARWFDEPVGDRVRELLRLLVNAEDEIRCALDTIASYAPLGDHPERVRFDGVWSAVTLCAQGVTVLSKSSLGILRIPLSRLGRRPSELAWRMSQPVVIVPGEVLGLLIGLQSTDIVESEFIARRREITENYTRFMRENAPGWARIGIGLPIADAS